MELHVFVHCVSRSVCIKLWKIISGAGYDPVSPPDGFMGDGILELRKEDYLDIIKEHNLSEKHAMAKGWTKEIFETKDLVKRIVVEDSE